MPVTCPIHFQPLSTEEFAELDYALMKHAFAGHTELGRLADEQIYQADFAARVRSDGCKVTREVPVTVSFGDFVKAYSLDMVVADKAIYEIQGVEQTDTGA